MVLREPRTSPPICVTAVIEFLADVHVHIKLIWVHVLVHNPGVCLSRPRGGPGLFSFTSLRAAVAALGPGPRQPVPGSVRGVALLVVFAGLPGSGKSVLACGVAEAIRATYLRIDTIESAIVSTLMPYRDNPVGYVVAERVAADQLADGRDVVADAVNGVAAARAGWVALAARTGASVQFVEVRCSDAGEHRRRVEAREPEMPGHGVPTWAQVLRRRYEPWPPELSGRLVVDNISDAAGHVGHIVTGLTRRRRDRTGGSA